MATDPGNFGSGPVQGGAQGAVPPADPNRRDATRVLRAPGKPRPSRPKDHSGGTFKLPSMGDRLFGFQLRQELGRGSFARVFLAEQAELAGRSVVLKISSIAGHEPQTLAQLQHTHIVPIHSVHEDAAAGLRAVCMPYFGGASLNRVLGALWLAGRPPAQGKQLTEALARVGCWSPGA